MRAFWLISRSGEIRCVTHVLFRAVGCRSCPFLIRQETSRGKFVVHFSLFIARRISCEQTCVPSSSTGSSLIFQHNNSGNLREKTCYFCASSDPAHYTYHKHSLTRRATRAERKFSQHSADSVRHSGRRFKSSSSRDFSKNKGRQ